MFFRQTIAILNGRHDDMKRAAVVENRLREQGIRTISETTQANQRATRHTLADHTPERDIHQSGRRSREPTVPSHRESRHASSRSRKALRPTPSTVTRETPVAEAEGIEPLIP